MSNIEELSRNIVQTSFNSLSNQDIEFAKNRAIDVLGCVVGGAYATGNTAIYELIQEWGGKEEARVLGYGIKVPAYNASFLNCVMANSYDYDVSGFYMENMNFPCHSHSVTVPTAFTIADSLHSTGKELLTALILGDDLLARLTAAADWMGALDDTTWDCRGTMSKWGATAITGKLLKLDILQMINSFGIVIDTLTCTKQSMFDGVQSFKLHGGLGSRDAIISAKLASKGFIGIKDALQSELGLFNGFFKHNLTLFPDALSRGLGKNFYSSAGFGHKVYPCCGDNGLYIECALKIIKKHEFDPNNITEIQITRTKKKDEFVSRSLYLPYDSSNACQTRATFSISYNVANIFVRKTATKLIHFTEDAVRDPKVIEIAKKVKFVAETSQPEKGINITLKMKDGTIIEDWANSVKGMRGRALTKDEIKNKFWENVAFSKIINAEKAKKALIMIDHLEEIDNVSTIIDNLVA